MRIKKKDVLLEAQLIDSTSEFTPQEKKMLKTLKKKFGAGGYDSSYNRWDGAAFLIEEMGIPYDQAYDLSLTHWWYGDRLYEEVESIYKKEDRGYLYQRVIQQLLKPYIEGRDETLGDITTTWEDPDHIISQEGLFTIKDSVTLWEGPAGFTLYIPMENRKLRDVSDRENTREFYDVSNKNTLSVSIKFIPYIEKGHPKMDTHVKFDVTYAVGDSTIRGNKSSEINMMSFDIPIPSPLDKGSIYKIFTDSINDVLEKIESMTFGLVPPDDDLES